MSFTADTISATSTGGATHMTAEAPARHLPYILVYPNLKDHSSAAKHGSTTQQQITGQQRQQVQQYIGSVELAFERAAKRLPATENTSSATTPAALAMAGEGYCCPVYRIGCGHGSTRAGPQLWLNSGSSTSWPEGVPFAAPLLGTANAPPFPSLPLLTQGAGGGW